MRFKVLCSDLTNCRSRSHGFQPWQVLAGYATVANRGYAVGSFGPYAWSHKMLNHTPANS